MHIFAILTVIFVFGWLICRLPDGFNYVILLCCTAAPLLAIGLGMKAWNENPHMDLELMLMAVFILVFMFGVFAAIVRSAFR